MNGFIHRALGGRTVTTVCVAFGLAVASAQGADAAGPKLFANGLHIASGAIEDPAHRMWVTDHNAGFCRVTNPAEGPGTIEHPQTPGDTTSERTCLGGLLPHAAQGPDAAMAPVFIDPSPYAPDSGDEFVLIPDVAAPSGDVVRADWNVETRKFEFRDVILMDADPIEAERPRPAALSLAPDGSVYAVFQRSGSVQRIVNPEAAKPTVQLIARTSDGRGATAVAAVHGAFGPFSPAKVVLAEATGLRETVGTPTDPAAPRVTRDSFYDVPDGAAGPSLVGALAYEITSELAGTGRLYAGTANAEVFERPGPDKVYRWDTAPQAATLGTEHANGFLAVAGLGLRPQNGDDTVFVLDDPTIVLEGEPIGTGRMSALVATWARIHEGPEGETNQAQPTFTFDGEPALECDLTGPGQDPGFEACTSPLQTPVLGAGEYTLSVRPVTETNDAPAEKRSFTVDTTAEAGKPTIVSPKQGKYTSARPYFEFAPPLGLPEGGYRCRITPATDFAPCAEGRPGTALEPGEHTLTIVAVDRAGNVGTVESDPVTFTVGAPPEDSPAEAPAGDLAAPESWTDYAGGLHISTGAIEAPDGSIWVTDHNAGFCRISHPSISGPGKIEHPELPNRPAAEPRTCLGGLLPEARPGADAAGQPVLVDPTPAKRGSGDEVVLVPDGATKMGSLFRAQWNPSTGRFDPLDEFVGPLDDNDRGPRPTATALGPDPDGNGPQQPDLFYVTKKEDWIVRVQDPATDPKASIVGFTATGRGAEALAIGTATIADADGNPVKKPVLYLSEPDAVTRLIDPTGPDRGINGTTPQAETLTIAGAPAPSAMAYDQARDLLYMGTAAAAGEPDAVPPIPTVPGIDRIMRFHVGGTDTATPGVPTPVGEPFGKFSMVGGLGLRPDGRLLVADDVALTMATEPIGTGRLFQVGAPAARISAGPSDAGEPALDPTWTSSLNPEFTLAGDGPMECALREKGDGPEGALTWTACAPETVAADGIAVTARDLTGGADLVSGKAYRLTVRSTKGYTPPADPAAPKAIDDTTKFVPHTIEFTVDGDAPKTPLLSVVKKDGLSSAAPMFAFTPVDESPSGLEFRCRLNDATEFTACTPGRAYPLKEDGTSQLRDAGNVLQVKAVDRAGNESAVAGELTWDADTTIPVVKITSTPEGSAELVRIGAGDVTFATTAEDAGPGGTPRIGCRLNGEAWQSPCPAVTPPYTDLPSGTHVFTAHAIDHYGNHSATVKRKIVVDKQGPDVLFDSPAALSLTGPNPTIAFRADPETVGEGEPGQTYECTLVRPDASTTPVACAAPSVQLSNLTTGVHKLLVTGKDSDLGNAGGQATFEWTVDASGPVVTFAAGDPADGVELLNRPTFTFASNETATFQCAYLLGDTIVQDFRVCRSPERSGGLAASTEVYTFVLVARDGFGNVGQYRRSFRIVDALGTPAPAPAPPSTVPVVVPPLDPPGTPGQTQGQGRSQGPGRGQGQGRNRGGVANVGVPITLTAPTLQARGLPVTVQATAGTNVVRVQVFALTGGGQVQAAAASKPKRRLVATVWQSTPKAKTYRLRLKDRKVRSLRPGRYVVEVRGGASRKKLGQPKTKAFVVKR